MYERLYPCFNGKDLTDDFIYTDIIGTENFLDICHEEQKTLCDHIYEDKGLLWRVKWDVSSSWVSIACIGVATGEPSQARTDKALKEYEDYFLSVNDGYDESCEWQLRCVTSIRYNTINASYRFVKE